MSKPNPASYNKWVAITKSDTINIGEVTANDGNALLPSAVYVGGAGDLVAVASNNATATFTAVAGTTLLIQPKRINSTSTTASAMVALYQE